MLSEKQSKMVQFSEEVMKNENKEELAKLQERLLIEKKLRKTVHDSIVTLTDTVPEDELLSLLPNLDLTTWEEVIEERSLAKLCGFPLCNKEHIPHQSQTYYIDRKERKIFEANKERNRFCTSNCFQRSSFIKAQLDEHPLWITGLNDTRTRKTYKIQHDFPVTDEHKEYRRLKPIEIISKTSNIVKSLNELKIAERAESDDDNSDEDGIAGKDDQDFLDSLQRFIKQKPNATKDSSRNPFKLPSTNENIGYQPSYFSGMTDCSNLKSNKDISVSPKSQNNKALVDKEEKLRNIRSKYGNNKRAAPVMIDALPISTAKLRETVRAEASVPGQESYPDVDQGPSSDISSKIVKEVEVMPANQDDAHYVIELFKNWWTAETAEIVKSGGRKPCGDTDKLLLSYMQGDFSENQGNVKLPDVDSLDVKRKRLRILIESLKPTWMKMERFFGKTSSSSQYLVDLLSTFNLDPSTITGFEKKHTHLIVSVLWRIACYMDSSLEEVYFQQPQGSPVVLDYFLKISLIPETYNQIVEFVMNFIISK